LTGELTYISGNTRLQFLYERVRLWEQPVTAYLTGGPGLLPLSPLCQLAADRPVEQAVREVIHQIDQRLVAEVPHERAVKLMTATFVLAGLRLPRPALAEVFRGVRVMHESSAFEFYEEKGREEGRQVGLQEGRQVGLQEGRQVGLQEGRQVGLQEGRVEELHRVLIRQGRRRFGDPDAVTQTELDAIQDIDRLERMADAILKAASWQELLETK
jgi:predicted transposase YdaD